MPLNGFPNPSSGLSSLKLGDKQTLVNNLTTKSQSATMADSTLSLINKVANLGYVGSKRVASGTSTSSGTSLTVNGLSFQPSYVMAYYTPSTSWSQYSIYDKRIGASNMVTNGSSFSSYTYSPPTNGFTLSVGIGNSSYTWIAIE